jgi:hypothetical protein
MRAGMTVAVGKSWERATGIQESLRSDSMTLLSVLISMFIERKRKLDEIVAVLDRARLHNYFAIAIVMKLAANPVECGQWMQC